MDQITIDNYNQFANEYDMETGDFWNRFPRTVFDKFAKLLPLNARILDLGSGPGRDGLILKELGLNILCLDASQAMLDIAKSRGLTTILADLSKKLPFPDHSFNGVWAYTSLLHIPKSEVDFVINEIFRVLNPGGIFGLGLIEGDIEGYKEDEQMTRWFSYYQRLEIENLLNGRQFEIIYFESFKPKTRNYLNFIAKRSEQPKLLQW